MNLDNNGILKESSKEGMKAEEEAANVLLAFSSPDTLKPSVPNMPGLIPRMNGSMRERRLTLDSEEFVLDGGVREGSRNGARSGVVGKTARDILKM